MAVPGSRRYHRALHVKNHTCLSKSFTVGRMAVIDRLLGELQATTARYEDRTAERRDRRQRIEDGGILCGDDADRVKKRLGRLNASLALARATAGKAEDPDDDVGPIPPREPALYGADVIGLERLLGDSDLIDAGFLQRGAIASRAIGRVHALSATERAYGTGFLVSPGLLITNHHVLPSAQDAARSFVEFDYQAGLNGLPLTAHAFVLQPDRCFVTHAPLDFTLVAVAPRSGSGIDLSRFGFLPPIETEGKVLIGEKVNIIQHPGGEPKQLAMRKNEIIDLLEEFVHYETDTGPGSSGAPVFNDQWEVVALHHSGVPATDAEGHYVARDDSRWTPARGTRELKWKANEGVRISRVLREVRKRKLKGTAAELCGELLRRATAPPPSPWADLTESQPVGASVNGTGAAGAVQVTITVSGGTVAVAGLTPSPTADQP